MNYGQNALSSKIDGTSTYFAVWANQNSTNGQRFNINFGTADETVRLRPNAVTRLEANKYGATVTGAMSADSGTFTNITGTLQTAAQSNVTSLGTLTGLTVGGDLTLDSSGAILFDKSDQSLKFGDNVRTKFGDGNDLNVYHHNGASVIRENNAQPIYIQSNNASTGIIFTKVGATEEMARFVADGKVSLRYNNVEKFETTDSGVNIIGELTTDSATIEAGVLHIKNIGEQSQVRLYCEANNAHYAAIQAPAHATFGGNVVLTLPSATGTLISTSNSNAPTTTTSASDADFVLIDDGGTMKKITPANLGISSGITIQDSGGSLSNLATTLNFVGPGVVASGTGSTKTITISGGGGGGGGSVAGGDTQVQFNDGGVLGADADFTFAKSTNTLTIGGPLIATSKSFDIKHPTKKGKRLRYGSLEGPENGVYIRGRANSSKINLPDYWTGLVDEETITVELTPIGKHQKLYVEDIANNVVTIGNDNMIKKDINCFYTIYGERKTSTN